MAWTSPRTWVTGELVTAALMNTHVRDNLAALLPVDQVEWDSWTPTLTNFTLGNGTLTALYTQIAKTVIARLHFTLGSTSAVGTSGTFSTPVTAAAAYVAATNLIGEAHLFDTGTASLDGGIRLESTTTFRPVSFASSANFASHTGITATSPFTWVTGDSISLTVMYEAA